MATHILQSHTNITNPNIYVVVETYQGTKAFGPLHGEIFSHLEPRPRSVNPGASLPPPKEGRSHRSEVPQERADGAHRPEMRTKWTGGSNLQTKLRNGHPAPLKPNPSGDTIFSRSLFGPAEPVLKVHRVHPYCMPTKPNRGMRVSKLRTHHLTHVQMVLK